jgi:hypothetical protein
MHGLFVQSVYTPSCHTLMLRLITSTLCWNIQGLLKLIYLFVTYSMTLPVARLGPQIRLAGWCVSNELESFCKEEDVAWLQAVSRFLPGRTEEAHEKPQFVQAVFWKIFVPRTTLMWSRNLVHSIPAFVDAALIFLWKYSYVSRKAFRNPYTFRSLKFLRKPSYYKSSNEWQIRSGRSRLINFIDYFPSCDAGTPCTTGTQEFIRLLWE